jgi:hypothetical protein
MAYLESAQLIFRDVHLRDARQNVTLNNLEKAVFQVIRASRPEVALALDEQLEGIVVSSRENTNTGFFTTMRPLHTQALIKQPRVIGNVFAKIEGMQNPMTFTLFIKDGVIDTLEGASIEESTADIDFSIAKFEIVKATMPH